MLSIAREVGAELTVSIRPLTLLVDYGGHVQVSTVGYGDVTLKSDWGRVVIVCAIVTALVILPLQINGILQLASRRSVAFVKFSTFPLSASYNMTCN